MRSFLLVFLCLPMVALAQDADADGVVDVGDNCVGTYNPLQDDSNQDGFGDVCVDPTASVGAGLVLGSGALVEARASLGAGVQLGESTVVARTAGIGDGGIIGDNVMFGRAAQVLAAADIGDFVLYGYGATAGSDLTLGANAVIGSLVQLGSNVTLGVGAVVARGSVLADDVVLGDGAVLGPDVTLGAGVAIGDNARVRKQATIEAGATVQRDARVGRGATVGAGANVGEGAVIGALAVIVSGAVVPDNTVVLRGETYGGSPEICGDTLDNDGNGLIDCEDSACMSVCMETCDDGDDNDGDGFVDCADDDCWGLDCHPSGVRSWVTGGTVYLDHFNPTIRYTTYTLSNTSSCQFGSVQNHTQNQRFEARNIQGQVAVEVDSEVRLCDWSYTLATGAAAVTYGVPFDVSARSGFNLVNPEHCRLAGSSFLPSRVGVDSSQVSWFGTVQTSSGGSTLDRGVWLAGNGNAAWIPAALPSPECDEHDHDGGHLQRVSGGGAH